MPNWCYTNFEVQSSNKEGLKKVEEVFTNAKSECRTDFGESWLGHIVLAEHIVEDIEDEKCPRCRGTLDWFEYDDVDSALRFDTTTAWGPVFEMFDIIFDKYLGKNNYELFYSSTDEVGSFHTTNRDDKVGTVGMCYQRNKLEYDVNADFIPWNYALELIERDFPEIEKYDGVMPHGEYLCNVFEWCHDQDEIDGFGFWEWEYEEAVE